MLYSLGVLSVIYLNLQYSQGNSEDAFLYAVLGGFYRNHFYLGFLQLYGYGWLKRSLEGILDVNLESHIYLVLFGVLKSISCPL